MNTTASTTTDINSHKIRQDIQDIDIDPPIGIFFRLHLTPPEVIDVEVENQVLDLCDDNLDTFCRDFCAKKRPSKPIKRSKKRTFKYFTDEEADQREIEYDKKRKALCPT